MLQLNLPRPSRAARESSEITKKSEEIEPSTFVGPLEADAVVDHGEVVIAPVLEERSAKTPSDLFLWAGLGSMATALTLHMAGKKAAGLLVGQMAAPLLVLGVYTKIKRPEIV